MPPVLITKRRLNFQFPALFVSAGHFTESAAPQAQLRVLNQACRYAIAD
jgi:hypothetical protein